MGDLLSGKRKRGQDAPSEQPCQAPHVFGAISDKVGRKWLMLGACLLAVVTYIPVYKAMQHAVGNNVVTVRSTENKVTGAISLTAMTIDPATNAQVPAKEAANPNVPLLVLLVFIQVIYVCMVYGPIAAYLVEAFPAKIRYTSLSLHYHIGNGVFGGFGTRWAARNRRFSRITRADLCKTAVPVSDGETVNQSTEKTQRIATSGNADGEHREHCPS